MKYAGFCAYCGNWRLMTKDHVIPRCDGGQAVLLVCTWCNINKGNHDLEVRYVHRYLHSLYQTWVARLPPDAPQHVYVPRFVRANKKTIQEFFEIQKRSCKPWERLH